MLLGAGWRLRTTRIDEAPHGSSPLRNASLAALLAQTCDPHSRHGRPPSHIWNFPWSIFRGREWWRVERSWAAAIGCRMPAVGAKRAFPARCGFERGNDIQINRFASDKLDSLPLRHLVSNCRDRSAHCRESRAVLRHFPARTVLGRAERRREQAQQFREFSAPVSRSTVWLNSLHCREYAGKFASRPPLFRGCRSTGTGRKLPMPS